MIRPLKTRLKEEMKARGVKVPGLSALTGIPKDRIYAWYRDNSTPKAEDQERLERWLNGDTSIKIEENGNGNRETSQSQQVKQNSTPGYVPAADLIEVLKEQNEFLRRNFETSLDALLEGQQHIGSQISGMTYYSILALNGGDHHKTLEVISKLNNGEADELGLTGKDGNLDKADSGRTGRTRQQR